MGAQLNGGVGSRSSGRSRKRRATKKALMSEINVTPFVDVMLVLLIIFMVTAPLLTTGVKIDLPKETTAPVPGDDEPLSISIKDNGDIFIQNTQISLKEIAPKLIAISGQKMDTRIFVRGDKNIDYGHVMQVVSSINQAGFNKVALVTEAP